MIISLRGLLVPLVFMAVLTSCNSYLKPENPNVSISKINDTTFLAQSLYFSSYVYNAAQFAGNASKNTDFKDYTRKIITFQGNSKNKIDSLSRIKGIHITDEMPKEFQKSLQQLKRVNNKKIELEFINQMESRMVKQINLLETFGKNSEDNEATTLAALLLSGTQEELKEMLGLRQKIATQ